MEKDIERKYVKDIMEYFKEHKLDEEGKEVLRHTIKEIFRIEITQIDGVKASVKPINIKEKQM